MTLAASACILAVATALACAIPGTFVVLNKESMVIDGIGHAVLPGIAVGYMFTGDLGSPVLTVTAALGALAVALGTQCLRRSGLVSSDAALGLVFPAMFSFGVILISARLSHVHLDVHAVLVGDVNLVALTSPGYAGTLFAIAAVNLAFVLVFLPRLTACAFDAPFARVSGVGVGALHTAFMALVALTASAAFHTAGAMLVIALMVLPVVCARLTCRRLTHLIPLTCAIALANALVGFWCAYHLNLATSPSIALANALLLCALLIPRFRARARLAA
ncbi:metal ABC transporter permease [Corynebacterium liangguodongii]|uniref:Zinc ABC transporter permease n=1 Tax=Corynebacterium liangguodongii TaxID=2079535 RepID=A0A2S0WGT7_9CORY|nr:metal ABC transporter permease [Corynebacterium liangguodongii]AWB84989.1 zinc ABC transporter permease [Corynebacterium liangguodongii]PWC00691.1 metal ABC transporter permease [Corynebacterium liangguodongii]